MRGRKLPWCLTCGRCSAAARVWGSIIALVIEQIEAIMGEQLVVMATLQPASAQLGEHSVARRSTVDPFRV